MIQVSSLSKSYGKELIFDNVSFIVGRGERAGLVGRNGSGKSTLFRLILGAEEPDSGEISVPRNYRLGHLEQHIRFSEATVLKEACLAIRSNDDGTDETYKAEKVLIGLGIAEELFSTSPLKLSGGLQVRLNLAKSLISEPDMLLLDEPTNYLDITSIRWLGRFLKDWKGELMLITHDRAFMDSVTTHTMAIHRNRVRKLKGPTYNIYAQIAAEEEVYEKTRLSSEKKRKETEEFIARFRAKATKARAVQSRIKALEKAEKLGELGVIRTLDFEFNHSPFSGRWLIEALDLSFSYNGGAPLVRDLSLAIGKKDRIGVIGRNGKGKTTLLNLLAGELKPAAGELKTHPNLKLAYFGQTNVERLKELNTVEEELMQTSVLMSRNEARKAAGAMMFEGDAALKKISVLSGGEKSRVLLGKLLLSPANLLLLDEPTNHLDMDSIDSLVDAINAFDGAVVVVTHSEMILDSIATRLVVFDRDRVCAFEGTYADFLEKVGWEEESLEAVRAPQKGLNKKDVRKLRADIIAERTREIGPLEKRISEVEKTIIELEKAAEKASHALVEASGSGDSARIQSLSKEYHSCRERVDFLFDELESMMDDRDRRMKAFDERLGAVE